MNQESKKSLGKKHLESHQLTHPKYRADIDGLRGAAVLLVLLFHAFGLKGGFIGVDIFFVISGFLISTIIFNNLDSGNFSFVEFYSRRIRRIFPALSLVLIACFAFGWWALFADEFGQLGNHIFQGSYFVSNFALLKESGYFDNAAETKPLLHLWSLAVEEQFYIIWPLLLWFAWKLRLNLFIVAIFCLIASFSFNLVQMQSDKAAAFYLPQSRFWEILVGSMLAYVVIYKQSFFAKLGDISNVKISKDVISILGATLVIIGVLTITRDKNFPGFWAILPTLGVLLVIACGASAWFNRVVLQNRFLMFFGLISYPLYLWHWPLLVFARIVESDKPSLLIRIFLVAVAIILAWLTYKFVEKPVRFGKFLKLKTVILTLLMIAIGFSGYVCFKNDGFVGRSSIKNYQQLVDNEDILKTTRESDGSCDKFELGDKIVCLANSAKPEFLIVGDSHAMSLNSAAYLKKVDLKTILIAAHDCVPFEKYTRSSDSCANVAVQAKIAVAKIKSIKTVIINSFAPEKFDGFRRIKDTNLNPDVKSGEDMFVAGYQDLILAFVKAGKNVVFVFDNPRLEYDPKRCFARPFREIPDSCKISKDKVLASQNLYRQQVEKIKQNIDQLKILDSLQILCDANFCYGKGADEIYYYDKHHLNIAGSKKLLSDLRKI
jgi:peptidoglycan/LPS O-acetylase OafA/YrhL